MNKLLSMELKRAAKSPILWLGVIAVIAINVYGILLNGYGFKIFTTTFLLENSSLICMILAVLFLYTWVVILKTEQSTTRYPQDIQEKRFMLSN